MEVDIYSTITVVYSMEKGPCQGHVVLLTECMALFVEFTPLMIECMALPIEYITLMIEYMDLFIEYGTQLIECMAL